MRYSQLFEACRRKQPTAILEIGVRNGRGALGMLSAAPKAAYYGFDLFDDLTPEICAAEKNVMGTPALDVVRERLNGYNVTLIQGDTREMLAMFATPVDFVWIDGGHSVETIASDWVNVQRLLLPDAEVYFDDYYTGGGIDTKKYGCNEIVKKHKHWVLPMTDMVAGGGRVQMVRVWP